MTKSIRIYSVLLLVFSLNLSHAQDTDSSSVAVARKSPQKAALLSAIIPGAGQIYNHTAAKGKRRIWKVPIIYAGLATSGYFLYDNITNYKSLREEYLWRLADANNAPINYTNYSTDNVRTAIDQYKNWRDLSIVCIAGIYILQIVDASVDAHLFNHDISPNLSLRITPNIGFNTAGYYGVGLTLLKK